MLSMFQCCDRICDVIISPNSERIWSFPFSIRGHWLSNALKSSSVWRIFSEDFSLKDFGIEVFRIIRSKFWEHSSSNSKNSKKFLFQTKWIKMGEAEPTVQTSVEKIYKISTTDHIVQFIQSKFNKKMLVTKHFNKIFGDIFAHICRPKLKFCV